MQYREELIRRLQHEGSWDSMSAQDQSRLQNLPDDQAREVLVLEDEWTFGDTDAVHLLGMVSMVRVILSFKGALVKLEGEDVGRLSKAGRLLADFVIELSNRGLTAEDVEKGFNQLSPFVIAALLTSHKLTS